VRKRSTVNAERKAPVMKWRSLVLLAVNTAFRASGLRGRTPQLSNSRTGYASNKAPANPAWRRAACPVSGPIALAHALPVDR